MTTSENPDTTTALPFLRRFKQPMRSDEPFSLVPLSEAQASRLKATECLAVMGDAAFNTRDRSGAGNNYLAAIRLYRDALSCAAKVPSSTVQSNLPKDATVLPEDHCRAGALNGEVASSPATGVPDEVPFEELIAMAPEERRQHAMTLGRLSHAAHDRLAQRDSAAAIGVLVRPLRVIVWVCFCVGIIALLAYQWSLRTDLARSASWRLSSSTGVCRPIDRGGCAPRQGIFFHTEQEQNPWIEYDLGKLRSFSRIVVENSRDGYRDRAVPLIVEISDDGADWDEIARRESVFATWTSVFPAVTARFVRLRAARQTYLHLARIEIHR